jgi:hypothetical protein
MEENSDVEFLEDESTFDKNTSVEFDHLIRCIQQLIEKRESGVLVSPEILLQLLEMLLTFASNFETGTSNENFILSLTKIEDLVIDLQRQLRNLTTDLLWEKISQINQKNQIEKKLNTLT